MSRDNVIVVDGQRVVLRCLAGTRPTLLLLHGAGGNHRSFDELVAHLAPHAVVAPSLPGRCGSEGSAPESVESATDWVLDVCKATCAGGPVVVCGHSYGGALAIELALCGAVAGAVLISTGARLHVHPVILERIRAAAGRGEHLDGGAVEYGRGTDPALIARVDHARSETPPLSALADWLAADDFDCMERVREVSIPVLAMGGTGDVLTPPKYLRYLAAHIAGAELELVDGAGHMLPAERPELVGERIKRFVAERLAE